MQPAQYASSAGCIRSLKPVVFVATFATSVYKVLLIDHKYSTTFWTHKNNFATMRKSFGKICLCPLQTMKILNWLLKIFTGKKKY
jgi:hypothetical protein